MMEIEIIPDGDDRIKERFEVIEESFKLSSNEMMQLFDIGRENYSKYHKGFDEVNDSKEYLRIRQEIEAIPSLLMIDDNERLIGYIRELQERYNINTKILAKLTKKEEKVIENILNNPCSVSIEDRYSIAMKVVYLLFLFSARG